MLHRYIKIKEYILINFVHSGERKIIFLPVLLCPLELCFAANISIVDPFLNTYFTLSFDLTETPRSQLISLFNPGMSLHIS